MVGMANPPKHQRVRSWLRAQPRWVTWAGGPWLVLLGLWIPILSTMYNHHASTIELVSVGVPMGSIALAATLVFGGGLGYLKQWRTVGKAALIGAGVLLFWLTWITLAGPDPNNQNDHSAGAATVILAIPTVIVVGTVVGLGSAIGRGVKGLLASA